MSPAKGFSFRDLEKNDGATAVEFALIAPLFILLTTGIICFTFLLSLYSSLQQISAEAARAALPGLSTTEQAQLVTNYVNSVIGNYSFMDPTKLTIATQGC
jgi:Flp pilus assembly protein TadG